MLRASSACRRCCSSASSRPTGCPACCRSVRALVPEHLRRPTRSAGRLRPAGSAPGALLGGPRRSASSVAVAVPRARDRARSAGRCAGEPAADAERARVAPDRRTADRTRLARALRPTRRRPASLLGAPSGLLLGRGRAQGRRATSPVRRSSLASDPDRSASSPATAAFLGVVFCAGLSPGCVAWRSAAGTARASCVGLAVGGLLAAYVASRTGELVDAATAPRPPSRPAAPARLELAVRLRASEAIARLAGRRAGRLPRARRCCPRRGRPGRLSSG